MAARKATAAPIRRSSITLRSQSTLKSQLQEFDSDARLFAYDNRKDARAKKHLDSRSKAKRELKQWEDYHKKVLVGFHQKKEKQRQATKRSCCAWLRWMCNGLMYGFQTGRSKTDEERKVQAMGTPATPVEWEHDPLKAKACKAPDEVEGNHGATELQMQILAEAKHDLEIPDPWFDEGSPYHWRRQDALEVMKSNKFQNFYTLVIVCNAVTLGMNANGAIGTTESTIVESIFTLLYTYEIYIRALGGQKYPWKQPSMWLDGTLWIIAAVDLWLFSLLNVLLGVPKPNMSMVMVLRLFRLTKIIKAAEKFSWIARPLRVIMIAARQTGVILSSIGFGYFVAIFAWSTLVLTVLQAADVRDVPHFSNLREATYAFTMIVMRGENWAETVAPGLLYESRSAAITFEAGAACLVFLNLFVFAMLSELVFAAAKVDDTKQEFKSIRDEMNLELIADLLERIDLKMDGHLDLDELARAYYKHPFIAEILGMTLDGAWQLFVELDQARIGRVSINSFLVGLFKAKCGRKDVEKLLFEYIIDRAEEGTAQTFQKTLEYANNVRIRTAMEKQERDEYEYEYDLVEEYGLVGEVEKMRVGMIMNETAQDLNYHDLDVAIQDLDSQLETLAEMINKTDFAGVHEVSEGTVRIAGMRLAAEMKKFAKITGDWIEDTQRTRNMLLSVGEESESL